MHQAVTRRGPLVLLSLVPLCLAGCNPDPTDPENVAPITLTNGTSDAVRVFWCAGDGDDACAEQESLGVVAAGGTRRVRISSYEVLLRIKPASGPGGYVCEDDAPGNRIALSTAYPSAESAYDHCADGSSASPTG
ncbi:MULTISPECIES: hypothetical protein [unclassified Streptomyces]|uniref:hypothetical protein n=1 Tax=unclassified Streptomyces TaxID=2593676 RepID=UPI00343CA390